MLCGRPAQTGAGGLSRACCCLQNVEQMKVVPPVAGKSGQGDVKGDMVEGTNRCTGMPCPQVCIHPMRLGCSGTRQTEQPMASLAGWCIELHATHTMHELVALLLAAICGRLQGCGCISGQCG